MERIYKKLVPLTDYKINRILSDGLIEELIYLPLSVGEYHKNWKFAQDICIRLAEHTNSNVRSNALLGLSYIA